MDDSSEYRLDIFDLIKYDLPSKSWLALIKEMNMMVELLQKSKSLQLFFRYPGISTTTPTAASETIAEHPIAHMTMQIEHLYPRQSCWKRPKEQHPQASQKGRSYPLTGGSLRRLFL